VTTVEDGVSSSGELDAGTLERARQQQPAACKAFIRHHQRAVGALLRRMLGPAGLDALTEDLAQETFIRALRALPRFDSQGPAKLSTWLLRIASRLAINELRRRRPETQTIGEEASLAAPGTADADHRRRAIGAAIEAAVGALAPEFRAAFVLREYHGLDYTEIAASLELDLGTVKSRLHRARAKLRDALAEVRDV